jgi:hypothetical protein
MSYANYVCYTYLQKDWLVNMNFHEEFVFQHRTEKSKD